MRMRMTWAIARAEMRSLRRLTRYWVFSILAILVAFAGYMQYAVIHSLASSMSATVGIMGPRYLVSALGLYVLIIFLVGLVFMAFDVRARDVRERMAEVLDTRPVSNLEFVFGRGLGLVLMALAPVLVLGLILQTFGTLAILFQKAPQLIPLQTRIESFFEQSSALFFGEGLPANPMSVHKLCAELRRIEKRHER